MKIRWLLCDALRLTPAGWALTSVFASPSSWPLPAALREIVSKSDQINEGCGGRRCRQTGNKYLETKQSRIKLEYAAADDSHHSSIDVCGRRGRKKPFWVSLPVFVPDVLISWQNSPPPQQSLTASGLYWLSAARPLGFRTEWAPQGSDSLCCSASRGLCTVKNSTLSFSSFLYISSTSGVLFTFSTVSAQTGAASCRRPQLSNGYFVPEAESYDLGAPIVYTCEKGHKPAAEGWWATSLCQNGAWSPKPQCIGTCLYQLSIVTRCLAFEPHSLQAIVL